MKLGARIPAAFFTFTRPAGPCLRARSDARYEGISSTRAGELLRCVHGTSWPPRCLARSSRRLCAERTHVTQPSQGLVADVTTFKRSVPPSSGLGKLGDTAVQQTGKETVSRSCDEIQGSSRFPQLQLGQVSTAPLHREQEPCIGASCGGGGGVMGREGAGSRPLLGSQQLGRGLQNIPCPGQPTAGCQGSGYTQSLKSIC